MTLAEAISKLDQTATVADPNNALHLVCDIPTDDDGEDYIVSGDEVVLMRDGYRKETVYRVVDAE